jgi:ABC-type Fe3+-hydroxamate transport system substrate-binding protein
MPELQLQDQIDRTIVLNKPARKVICLVPSITEYIWDLGIEVIGLTKFCVHPPEARKKSTVIGGTKNPKIEKIIALQPDLIIANQEENRLEDIEALGKEFPVYVSKVEGLESALEMMMHLGVLLDRREKAEKICLKINSLWSNLPQLGPGKCIYLIWQEPFMVAGKGTYIDDVIGRLGLLNAVEEARYPIVEREELKSLDLDLVFLSSEPFPFKDQHCKELQYLLPQARVVLVDGEAFSWYGTRMIRAVKAFEALQQNL